MEEVKILCVDDEKNVLRALQRVFMDEEYEIFTAESGEEGLEVLADNPDILLIISDYRMSGLNGVEFLKKAYEQSPDTIRIVLSGYADTAAVVSAINDGKIYKFIPKPWNDDELLLTIKEAIEVFRLKQKNELLANQLMEANDELTQLNENLEQQVRDRTEELEFQIQAMRFAHNVMDTLPAPVLGLTPDGCIVLANKEAETLFQETPQSPLGMGAQQLFPDDLHAFFLKIVQEGPQESIFTLKDRPFTVRGTRMAAQGEQEGIILLFT